MDIEEVKKNLVHDYEADDEYYVEYIADLAEKEDSNLPLRELIREIESKNPYSAFYEKKTEYVSFENTYGDVDERNNVFRTIDAFPDERFSDQGATIATVYSTPNNDIVVHFNDNRYRDNETVKELIGEVIDSFELRNEVRKLHDIDVYYVDTKADLLRNYFVNLDSENGAGTIEENVVYNLKEFLSECERNSEHLFEKINEEATNYYYPLNDDCDTRDLKNFLDSVEKGKKEEDGFITISNDNNVSDTLLNFCKEQFAKEMSVRVSDNNWKKEVAQTLYELAYKYSDYAKNEYPTSESWNKAVLDWQVYDDVGWIYSEAYMNSGIDKQNFTKELKEILEKKGIEWDESIMSKADNRLEEAIIREDWESALGNYSVNELASKIGFGFKDEDISKLAELHKSGNDTMKFHIEALLDDCNFHSESSDFEKGRYDSYIKDDLQRSAGAYDKKKTDKERD